MNRFDKNTQSFLLGKLQEIILEERWNKFIKVIEQRTRHITVVLEDFYQPHNGSAVIRTCELKGIQDLHIIENYNPYEINPDIVVGANKWINIHRHNRAENNTLQCYTKLRSEGYHIVATSPHKNDYLINELPIGRKTALVFGNEGHGLSRSAIDNADAFVRIPSVGFTESYNLSVSAALCLYELRARLNNSTIPWQLSQDEKENLLLDYALKSIRKPEMVIKNLLRELAGRPK